MMRKTNSRLEWSNIIGHMYLYFPIVLFFMTWTKLRVGIPCLLLILFILAKVVKRNNVENFSELKRIKGVNMCFFALILIVLTIWCVASGIGGYVAQASDWGKHNIIIRALVERNWPVRLSVNGNSGVLTYYIGYYLVPAAFGKFYGFDMANIVMLVWTVVGLYLICHNIMLTFGKRYKDIILVGIVLIMFSVLVIPLSGLYRIWNPEDVGNVTHWLSQSIRIQYCSNIVSMRFVSPQFIPAAVSVTLLMRERQYKNWGSIILPCILYSPFTLAGTAIMASCVILFSVISKNKNLKQAIVELLSMENIAAVVVAIPLVVYVVGTMIQTKPKEVGMSFTWIDYLDNVFLLILFQLSWMIWAFLLWKTSKENTWFLSACVLLFILPFFSYGYYNDLCMRTSIPALCVMCVFVFKGIIDYREHNKQFAWGLFLILMLNSIGYSKELVDAIGKTGVGLGNYREIYTEIEEFVVDRDIYYYQYVNWFEDDIVKAILNDK